jgi:glycosyltransferase involved in cell wall biosynthesis
MPAADSVLMVIPRWVRDGGVAAHVASSAGALARHGTRVSVLTGKVESDETPDGVTLYHSPELFNRNAPVEVRFGDALASEPSVVHLHQLDDPLVVDFLRRRSSVVISSHGYLACTSGYHYFAPGQECQRAHGPGCVPNLPRCAHTRDPRMLPHSYRRAGRALAALSQADMAISYSTAVDRHLAINGLARRRIVPYFPTVEPRTGSGHEGRRRVVFAGRIVAPKGVRTLVEAAREVPGEFVICGDGWQLQAMRRLASRRGVEDRVRFKGWLDPVGLAQEFADASLVVVPSLWPEPFGIVGIEAFAAGRPAVASDTGGIGDWLKDGVSGLLFPAGDAGALAAALGELLDDPRRQAAMGAAGKATVAAKFSLEHHLTAISEAYAAARENWESARRGGLAPTAPAAPAATTLS